MLEDFPETIADDADEPLACALPPRPDPSLPAAVDEVHGLRPAYERNRAATGRTIVGRTVEADGIPSAVEAFCRIADGTPYEEAGLPGPANEVVLDIRAYEEEAALALADHVPGARASESWLYRTTEAGEVLRRAQQAMQAAGAPAQLWFYLVPVSQQGGEG